MRTTPTATFENVDLLDFWDIVPIMEAKEGFTSYQFDVTREIAERYLPEPRRRKTIMRFYTIWLHVRTFVEFSDKPPTDCQLELSLVYVVSRVPDDLRIISRSKHTVPVCESEGMLVVGF